MATIESRRGRSFDRAAPVVHRGGRLITGLGPGLYGGFVMAAIICILAVARGASPLSPFWVVASVFAGPRAMAGGAGYSLLGIGVHFVMAAILGMTFTGIFGRTTMARLLAFGFFYGLVLWVIVQFVWLPFLNPAVATHMGTVWPFFLGHIGYGLTLASAVPSVKDIDAPDQVYIDPLNREVRS